MDDGSRSALTEPSALLKLLRMLETDGEIGQCPRCGANPSLACPAEYHSERCELKNTIEALEAIQSDPPREPSGTEQEGL